MSKQNRKPKAADTVETVNETINTVDEQAVENSENFAENASELTASTEADIQESTEEEVVVEQTKSEKQKSGGKAIAVIALLVALGIGGAGHFLTNKKFAEVEREMQALAGKIGQAQPVQSAVELPNFDAEKAQLVKLTGDYQQALARVDQLEKEQNAYTQQIKALQAQVQKLGANPTAEPTAWLMSDADFLINNALRKVVLDNDIDTAKSMLIEADNVLSQVSDPKVLAIRDAIKADLNQLSSVNQVDQNALMQRLAQLANLVDDMPMVDNEEESKAENGDVSDSLEDWQKNIEKNTDSFLSHFIRINDKGSVANDKAFIAPNQEIYLRENIRLRLQIAIMTVPRQQNELYKQSLEAVSSWVRSYFDVNNEKVKQFLTEVDDLIEQSIYIDAPSRLQSLGLLEKSLNKVSKPIAKIQIEEEKSLEQLGNDEKAAEPKAEPAAETKVEGETAPATPAAQ